MGQRRMGVTRNFRDRLAPSHRARTGLGGGSRAGGPQGSWVSVKPGDVAQGPGSAAGGRSEGTGWGQLEQVSPGLGSWAKS